MKLSRIRKLIFLHLQHLPMKSRGQRATICKLGGYKFTIHQKRLSGKMSFLTLIILRIL